MASSSMQNLPNAQVAETYLEAYRTRDPGKALLAPDVSLQYPLTPKKIVGKQEVIQYMLSVMPGMDDIEIERRLTDGEYVAIVWKAHTVWGTMPACTVFRISAGLIQEVRSFFDPQPILKRS